MTVAGRIERLPWTSFHTRLLVLLSLGEFFELYDLFVGGFVVAPISAFYKVSTAVAIYYNIAVFFLGAFLGAIIFTYVGDALGRRTSLILNMVIAGIGLLLTPFSPSIQVLGTLRFITGLGVGPEALIVLDVLITEFFPSRIRGRALAIAYTASWTAPIVVAILAYLLIPHVYLIPGWKWLFIIGGLGIFTIIPFRFLIPESPRWLESKGRVDEADKIVSNMESIAMREKGSLEEPLQVQVITSQRVRISELFSNEYRKRTVMLWIFEFLQAGVYYGFASLAPSVLASKGFTLVHTLEYSMLIYTSYFLSSLASVFIIDSQRFDRKWQVSIVMLLMGITGLAFGFAITPVEVVATGFLFGFLSNIFSNAFHQYGAELYPTRMRAFADGVQYSLSRLGNYVWLSVLPLVLAKYGAVGMYTVVFVMALIVALDVGVLGPRASRIELEELSH
ncbi:MULTISPECIES: MFS transporter [Metallosphaera]|uniref:Major facilitator superfamily MFS_1 n=2 Tax=Metallosphaera sedula TaxID=43687 RepID=A4YDY8_METS5|nr:MULTISPECIES: MFS transporter [Metallosphaera]ABP94640.1 major facilitator superfamily MFS_1 [Metallosphaera sedula DSM 5348]AIM26627.1 major facilitator superfamily MFS_1 [Metallosphaera sedula]AKV73606.1 MFS transporter [Metallosphaera sedula]AKV75847.1 MFS transporter [Metallosphaera sedula]AKV78096.1 MFS transporter [Metallosphaera sedula]